MESESDDGDRAPGDVKGVVPMCENGAVVVGAKLMRGVVNRQIADSRQLRIASRRTVIRLRRCPSRF